jgi:hypothetical protein
MLTASFLNRLQISSSNSGLRERTVTDELDGVNEV